LLILADPAFDVFLTLDKNVPYQQNLTTRRIGILIIRARSSRMQDLVPLIPACLSALTAIKPGEVIRLAN
jgi:hypothetical protein